MKNVFIIVLLMFTMSLSFGGNVIKTKDSDKAYRTAKRELLELGFEVSYVIRNSTLLERRIGSWFYQVIVTQKNRKKIEIDIYAFIDGNFKKSWSNPETTDAVFRDINKAIEYRIEHNERIPQLMLFALWGIRRDVNITDIE